MSINKILGSLEKSWERNDILFKIKEGLSTDEIVNQFLEINNQEIKELSTLLKPEDIDLLNQVEQLSICESKLINEINNLNYSKNNVNHQRIIEKKNSSSNMNRTNRISLFMINWSNKFVIIALLTISAISLSKQAWS
tara:strand:- start:300 stop:713 length:414 start_codon:yes stop_codon:yes gene_type:complete